KSCSDIPKYNFVHPLDAAAVNAIERKAVLPPFVGSQDASMLSPLCPPVQRALKYSYVPRFKELQGKINEYHVVNEEAKDTIIDEKGKSCTNTKASASECVPDNLEKLPSKANEKNQKKDKEANLETQ
ncbi:hypothetical protein MKW92_050102, partial [Papaver armeniacum]